MRHKRFNDFFHRLFGALEDCAVEEMFLDIEWHFDDEVYFKMDSLEILAATMQGYTMHTNFNPFEALVPVKDKR